MTLKLKTDLGHALDMWGDLAKGSEKIIHRAAVCPPTLGETRRLQAQASAWLKTVESSTSSLFEETAKSRALFRLSRDPALQEALTEASALHHAWYIKSRSASPYELYQRCIASIEKALRKLDREIHRVLDALEALVDTIGQIPGRALEVSRSKRVRDEYRKLLERRGSDASAAFTTARSLLETVAKHVMDETGVTYEGTDSCGTLFAKACIGVGAHASKLSDNELKMLSQSTGNFVEKLGLVRNVFGDSHGKGKSAPKPPADYFAWLAVDLAIAASVFLEGALRDMRSATLTPPLTPTK